MENRDKQTLLIPGPVPYKKRGGVGESMYPPIEMGGIMAPPRPLFFL